jgi:hypothetical protein
MGVPPRIGNSQDYGFGVEKFTKGGKEMVYPRANDLPPISFDPSEPVEPQIASISAQMKALVPAVETLIDKNLSKARITSPFDVDVRLNDGQTINLAKAAPGSLSPDTVNQALEMILKQHTFQNVRADVAAFYGVSAPPGTTVNVTGAKALAKMEEVAERAVDLAKRGLGPPIPTGPGREEEYVQAVKAFLIRNLFHGENLTTKHIAQGFDVQQRNPDLNEALSHDVIDRVSIQAVLQIDSKALDPVWARAWVLEEIQQQAPTEYARLVPNQTDRSPEAMAAVVDAPTLTALVKAHPEWTLNPNAGEPRYALSMYHWGDERSDADGMMAWHRAVNHHDGDLAAGSVDLQQKKMNGIEHHAGPEHLGVRHEASRPYDGALPFENSIRKIYADPAFRDPFWRQSAMQGIVMQRVLQERGLITPEMVQQQVNPERNLALDHAYQTLQSLNTQADRALRTLGPQLSSQGEVPELKKKIDTLTNVEAARATVRSRLPGLWEGVRDIPNPEVRSKMVQYFEAKMLQLAPRSEESVALLMPYAELARQELETLKQKPLTSLTQAEVTALRTTLSELPDAANEAKVGGDSSLAAVYRVWNDAVTAGFPSQYH